MAVSVELLYFEGCPMWESAWAALGLALEATGVDANVRLLNIEGADPVALRGFAGSPTIRVDGRDLEGYDGEPVLACRRYEINAGRGWPSQEQLHGALLGAAGSRAGAGGNRDS